MIFDNLAIIYKKQVAPFVHLGKFPKHFPRLILVIGLRYGHWKASTADHLDREPLRCLFPWDVGADRHRKIR
jgi:hypothetical protein